MSPEELLDYASANNVYLVQLYNNIDLLAFEQTDLKRIKAYADDRRIELAIGGVGIDASYLQELLQIAEQLDSITIRTIIAPPKGSDGRYETETVIDMIGSSIEQFEEAGRTLLIENHDRYTSKEYAAIIEAVNSEALGVCFDSANSIGTLEHFRDSFKLLKEFIVSCHFKEYCIERLDTKLGFIVEGCRPGTGENIAEEFLNLMKSKDDELDVVLEQWVPYQGTIEETLRVEKEWADEGIRILKSYT
jgi:sugar phosphate isomerase/epimerase